MIDNVAQWTTAKGAESQTATVPILVTCFAGGKPTNNRLSKAVLPGDGQDLARRFARPPRIIELDKEVTLGDAEQCVNLIDELIPLGLTQMISVGALWETLGCA